MINRRPRTEPLIPYFHPCIPGERDDYLFAPTRDEIKIERREKERLAKLRRWEDLKRKWDHEELAYMRRKIEAIAAVVEADRAWIARQNELDVELKKIQNYYAQEHAKEEAAADRARRERCLRLGKEIFRDAARAERMLLLARGVYRGR
jgi:hypothetical protein